MPGLALKKIAPPAPPRNEYDDAYDYIVEADADGQWTEIVVPEEGVGKTRRGLSRAAKQQGRKLRYVEIGPDAHGKVILQVTLRPLPKPDNSSAE